MSLFVSYFVPRLIVIAAFSAVILIPCVLLARSSSRQDG